MGPDGIYREYNYTADKYGFRINRRRSRVREPYVPPKGYPNFPPTPRTPTTPTTLPPLAGRTDIPAGAFRPYVTVATPTPSSGAGSGNLGSQGHGNGGNVGAGGGGSVTVPPITTLEPDGVLEGRNDPLSGYGLEGLDPQGPSSGENGLEAHASEHANSTLPVPPASDSGTASASASSNAQYGSSDSRTDVDKNHAAASAHAEGSGSSSQASSTLTSSQSSNSSSSSSSSSRITGDTRGSSSSSKITGDGTASSSAQVTGQSTHPNAGPVFPGPPSSSRTSGSTAKSLPNDFSGTNNGKQDVPNTQSSTTAPSTTRRPFALPYPPVVYNFSSSSGSGIPTRRPTSSTPDKPSQPTRPSNPVPVYSPQSYGPEFPEGKEAGEQQSCNVPNFPTNLKPSGVSKEEQQTADGKVIGKYKLTFPLGYVLEIAYTAYQDPSFVEPEPQHGSSKC